tara:strand:- start:672 stop:956 length:285 start_codon:yes stop_codon:yes gene_type:complete
LTVGVNNRRDLSQVHAQDQRQAPKSAIVSDGEVARIGGMKCPATACPRMAVLVGEILTDILPDNSFAEPSAFCRTSSSARALEPQQCSSYYGEG